MKSPETITMIILALLCAFYSMVSKEPCALISFAASTLFGIILVMIVQSQGIELKRRCRVANDFLDREIQTAEILFAQPHEASTPIRKPWRKFFAWLRKTLGQKQQGLLITPYGLNKQDRWSDLRLEVEIWSYRNGNDVILRLDYTLHNLPYNMMSLHRPGTDSDVHNLAKDLFRQFENGHVEQELLANLVSLSTATVAR